jgi:hypothetical protein
VAFADLKESGEPEEFFEFVLSVNDPVEGEVAGVLLEGLFVDFEFELGIFGVLAEPDFHLFMAEDEEYFLVFLHVFGHAVKDIGEEVCLNFGFHIKNRASVPTHTNSQFKIIINAAHVEC